MTLTTTLPVRARTVAYSKSSSDLLRPYVTAVACSPSPATGLAAGFSAPSVACALATCLMYSSVARLAPLPSDWSESKRVKPTSSQRYCEPLTPLSSRPFQEQLPREAVSLDVPGVPPLVLAFGTRSSIVFFAIDVQASGSAAYFAGSTVGSDFFALGADEEPDSFASPESDEQPHDDEHHRNGGAGEYAGQSRG